MASDYTCPTCGSDQLFFTRATTEWAHVIGWDHISDEPIINDASWTSDAFGSNDTWLQCERGHRFRDHTGYVIG